MEKSKTKYDLNDLENLPEKVLRLYEAVIQFAKEGAVITNLTVSEISSKAGIGKGTTYEYFESKEELISRAIYYSLYMNTKAALCIMAGDKDFKGKFYAIMDYMWSNKLNEDVTRSLFSAMKRGQSDQTDCMENSDKSREIITKTLENFIEQGIKEKAFKETDMTFCKYAICSQILHSVLFVQNENMYMKDKEEIKDYIYNGLILMLNQR